MDTRVRPKTREFDTIAELLKQLQLIPRTIMLGSPYRKKTSRKIRQWVRGLSPQELQQRMRIDSGAPQVKHVFSVLQSVQVMAPTRMGACRCVLGWGESSNPELVWPATATHDFEHDLVKLKHAETLLFDSLYVKWDQAVNGQNSFVCTLSSNDLADVLLVLSDRKCFLSESASPDTIHDIFWLQSLSRFTFGQYIAGVLELSLWQAFLRRNLPPPYTAPSPASACITQLFCQFPSVSRAAIALLYQEGHLALKDMMRSDEGTLSFFATIMKPRVKVSGGPLTISYISSRSIPYLRLWAAASGALSWDDSRRFFERQCKHSRAINGTVDIQLMLDCFLNVPLFDMNSFTLDHKIRTRGRLWNRGALLMGDVLFHSVTDALSNDVSSSPPAVSKRKSKRKAKRIKTPPRGNEVMETSHVKPRDQEIEETIINIPLSSSSVPQRIIDNTMNTVFMFRIVESIIDGAVNKSQLFRQQLSGHNKRNTNVPKWNGALGDAKRGTVCVQRGSTSQGSGLSIPAGQSIEWPPLPSRDRGEEATHNFSPRNREQMGESYLLQPNIEVKTPADVDINELAEAPIRGRILGSWSFGLNGNLSNDNDFSSKFFDLHRNHFSSNQSKRKFDTGHRFSLSSSSGKRDLIQKFLDDDDFWLSGKAENDHGDVTGIYSQDLSARARPWDRPRVILSRLSENSIANDLSEEHVGAAPVYGVVLSQDDREVEVEACLDLRNMPYQYNGLIENIATEIQKKPLPEEDSDYFDDFKFHNVLMLSPVFKDRPLALMDPVEFVTEHTSNHSSSLSSPSNTATGIVMTARSVVSNHDLSAHVERKQTEAFTVLKDASGIPLVEKKSPEVEKKSGGNNLVNSDDAAFLPACSHLFMSSPTVEKVSSGGDDPSNEEVARNSHDCSFTEQPIVHRTIRSESESNLGMISEQLKRSTSGLERSGETICTDLDYPHVVKSSVSRQRRKSGDWQQLHLSKRHCLYSSPSGRQFGRDDSDTRHYRRLIILDTRTPATSPILELGNRDWIPRREDTQVKNESLPLATFDEVMPLVEDSGAGDPILAARTFPASHETQSNDEDSIVDYPNSDVRVNLEVDIEKDCPEFDRSVIFQATIEVNTGCPEDATSELSSLPDQFDEDLDFHTSPSDGALPDDRSLPSDTIKKTAIADMNLAYLINSLALMRSQFESSVQVNMLAVQRSIIDYLGSRAAALQALGPHVFHPGQPPPFTQHSDMRYTDSVSYDRFLGSEQPILRRNYKTTEDINSTPNSSRSFQAPASPGIRPPLPKAAAPSTLLHTLNQEVVHARINDTDFESIGYNLRRRHSLSGSDNTNINVVVSHPMSPRTSTVSSIVSDDKFNLGKVRLGLNRLKEKEKLSPAMDDGLRNSQLPKDSLKQPPQLVTEATLYNNIFKVGLYEGMGPSSASPLTREIKYFVSILDSYSESVHRSKLDVLRRIRSCVSNQWPRAQAKPFGSFVTGISLPTSDLDVVICLPKVRKEAEPNAPGVLEGRNAIKQTWQQKLTQGLIREDWVDASSIRVIPNTAVPVLKFLTKKITCDNGQAVVFSFDISFEGPTHQGLEANKLIFSILRRYPALRPIVLILKCFLTRKGLCEAFTGGLSSYVLVLMVARFLQEQNSVKDIGALLLGVLDFYGNNLDPRATGISFTHACYFSREMNSVMGAPIHSRPTTSQAPMPSAPTSHSLNETYRLSTPNRLDIHGGFSSAPMSPAESVCGDPAPPYLSISYSEDYIGYVHSTSGDYSHHPGGSIMLSSGSLGISTAQHPIAGGNMTLLSHSFSGSSNNSPQQPPLFYKFDPFFVEDPLSRGNNIGRNCFRIYQVQKSWSDALTAMCIQIQHLDDLYLEAIEHASGRKDTANLFASSAPAIKDINPLDMSLMKSLVGDITSYRPW